MKTLLTFLLATLAFNIGLSQTRSTFRPSLALYWDETKTENFNRCLASSINFEIADIGKFHCSIGLFSFYTEHDYFLQYSTFSYIHDASYYSGTSTRTKYQCKMKELNHNATISLGWNSKYIKNIVHFAFHAGIMVPFYNTYSVSDFSGSKVTHHSAHNIIDGYVNSVKTEVLTVSASDFRIAEKTEMIQKKFLSLQLSFLLNRSLELGFDFILHSQPIRNAEDYYYDSELVEHTLFLSKGLRLTYNI